MKTEVKLNNIIRSYPRKKQSEHRIGHSTARTENTVRRFGSYCTAETTIFASVEPDPSVCFMRFHTQNNVMIEKNRHTPSDTTHNITYDCIQLVGTSTKYWYCVESVSRTATSFSVQLIRVPTSNCVWCMHCIHGLLALCYAVAVGFSFFFFFPHSLTHSPT